MAKKLTLRQLLKRLKRTAHKLWRECVLMKFDGKCVVCGATVLPNCHHIVSEHLFSWMRYNPDNGIVLCPSHHKFNRFSAHKNALWFVRVILYGVLGEIGMVKLITDMMETHTEKFVWTVELYQEEIKKLEEWKATFKERQKERAEWTSKAS